jgi:hypothetical protein
MWKKNGKQNKIGKFKAQQVFENLGRRPQLVINKQ